MNAATQDPTAGDANLAIERWDPEAFRARLPELMQIYTQAMGYHASAGTQRAQAASTHAVLPQFASRGAVAGDGVIVGFGYGYQSRPGQWWHELARKAIGPQLAASWMTDTFELSELHVRPEWQGRRLGRRILLDLAQSVTARTMVLSTPDADTRAFRLYRSMGFLDLARGHMFPGDPRPFAVLGRILPFD